MRPTRGKGLMADPNLLEVLTGRPVHPFAYRLEPQGARLVVVLERRPETVGGLHIPGTSSEILGAGFVMAVGAQVGSFSRYPGAPRVEPGELMYQHVYFGFHSGKGVVLPYLDRETIRTLTGSNTGEVATEVVLLTDVDIHLIDWDFVPTPNKE